MLNMIECENYREMSSRCAEELLLLVERNPRAKIILATGNSPLLTYRLFVKEIIHKQINISEVTWIKLDEWAGLPEENPATYEYFINKEILSPLNIKKDKYITFGGKGKNINQECEKVENLLGEIGKIDAAVVGIGRNGHIGLNEPAKELNIGAHCVKLDTITKTHKMLTSSGEHHVEYGITLGLDQILSAERLIVLATGEGKQNVYKKMTERKILTEVPATMLHLHRNAVCYVDVSSTK